MDGCLNTVILELTRPVDTLTHINTLVSPLVFPTAASCPDRDVRIVDSPSSLPLWLCAFTRWAHFFSLHILHHLSPWQPQPCVGKWRILCTTIQKQKSRYCTRTRHRWPTLWEDCERQGVSLQVREATSNDPWGPSSSLMSEIADLTFNVVAFAEVMGMVWKRLNDSGKNWRHVYKVLYLFVTFWCPFHLHKNTFFYYLIDCRIAVEHCLCLCLCTTLTSFRPWLCWITCWRRAQSEWLSSAARTYSPFRCCSSPNTPAGFTGIKCCDPGLCSG